MTSRLATLTAVVSILAVTSMWAFAGCSLPSSGLPRPDGGLEACESPVQCEDGNACTLDSCSGGFCGHDPLPEGRQPAQRAGDCQRITCMGTEEVLLADDRDVLSDENECTDDACVDGVPTFPSKSAETICHKGNSSGVCDGMGACRVTCGGPSDPPCNDGEPCTQDSCNVASSTCVYTPVADGTLIPGAAQPAGDCKIQICVNGKSVLDAPDDTDVNKTPSDCDQESCDATTHTPSNLPVAAGKSCVTSGGSVCDDAGQCVACNGDKDCAGDVTDCAHPACTNHVCGPTNVPDGTKLPDANQIPGDCKAKVCDGSGAAKEIVDDSDKKDDGNPCTSDVCSGGTLLHKNLASGAPCGTGLTCDGAGHCGCMQDTQCTAPATCGGCGMPGVCCCAPKTCASLGVFCGTVSDGCGGQLQCNDNTKNGGESDVDCGGLSCANKCAQGKACGQSSDCAANLTCTEGVCCDSGCGGKCQSCLAAKKGGGNNGTCGPVQVGTDPDSECADQGTASCGTDGFCDGGSACRKYPAGFVCSQASCATGMSVLNKADTCSAGGVCVDGGTQSCGNYACSSAACLTSCTSDAQCDAKAHCSGAICIPRSANGVACLAANECQSGNCLDGVCCGVAACPTCQSCGVAGSAGGCAFIPVGLPDTVPVGACATACDGAGNCKKPNGSACGTDMECVSGNCIDKVCCSTGACGTCQTCALGTGTCTAVPPGSIDDTCPSPDVCGAGGVCLKIAGEACGSATDCQSSLGCEDGVCCSGGPCTGVCQACNVAGAVGTCTNLPVGAVDPAPVCGGAADATHACNGSGACLLGNGQSCTNNNECASGNCGGAPGKTCQ